MLKKIFIVTIILSMLALPLIGCKPKENTNQEKDMNPKVIINLEDGRKIRLELYPEIAPKSVANFLKLVDEGYYTNVIFHRIIFDFMVQTGMLEYSESGLKSKPTTATIKGEFSDNGIKNDLKHEIGVISMARTNVMDSASGQFFICSSNSANVKNLDGKYAAFGKTIDEESNEVVVSLSKSITGRFNGMDDFPVKIVDNKQTPIVISSIERLP